jgi:hypothetical protein
MMGTGDPPFLVDAPRAHRLSLAMAKMSHTDVLGVWLKRIAGCVVIYFVATFAFAVVLELKGGAPLGRAVVAALAWPFQAPVYVVSKLSGHAPGS